MKIVDANIVLRYLLNDSDDLSEKAAIIIKNNATYLPNEVIAEIVYVLEKVYKVNKHDISSALAKFIEYENVKVSDPEIVNESLNIYAAKNLDFVDALLYSYHKVGKYDVYTFDKKLNKLLNR